MTKTLAMVLTLAIASPALAQAPSLGPSAAQTQAARAAAGYDTSRGGAYMTEMQRRLRALNQGSTTQSGGTGGGGTSGADGPTVAHHGRPRSMRAWAAPLAGRPPDMAHDPKLVELMAETYWKTAGDGIQWDTAKQVAHELIGKRHSSGMPRLGKTRADEVREGMRSVLDAIDASGMYWVAPWN